ncbi:MAG: aminopeptidase [Erysipelotrichaceae bacterium]|nr:aminopeptidase [Erysipelotrichaceae bacterium]
MNQTILRKYARLAVLKGANVQKDQLLVINASVRDAEFVEYCVEEAYKAGAGSVMVHWSDENVSHMGYQYSSVETLSEVPDWMVDRRKWEQESHCAYLMVDSDTPGLMADIDPQKMQTVQLAYMKKMEPYMAYTMNNEGQWCIVALPNPRWAVKVFPDKSEEEAQKALWDAILYSVRVREDNDPVAEWDSHNAEMVRHCDILNGYQFDRLHFESELGTDLYVGLVKNHIWVGGGCTTPEGVFFIPNMPTEECFCMPDRNNVNGIVHASKPLSFHGKVIEDFWFRFENGRVEDYGAAKEQETLKSLLDTDEGSRHLGEVALISYDSPISNLGILFFNTLFDENASCHLALGRCYPENVQGGIEMEPDQLMEAGGNNSMNHVDFMFGTPEMKVTGITSDGKEITVFEHGKFVI